jgi:hypothetical protein
MVPPPVQGRGQTQSRDDATSRLDLLMEMSRQLGTGLDADALSAIVDLLGQGVSTETVVAIVTELQRTTTT